MAYIGAGISRFNTADELTVTGDAQIDTTTLVVDSTNNRVGVGTSSPSTLLHLDASADGRVARFGSGTSDTGGMYVTHNSGSTRSFEVSADNILILDADRSNGRGSSRLQFNVDGSERMRITSAGSVGIGTTSPDRVFHVSRSSASVISGKFESASTSGSQIVFVDADTTTNDLQVRIGSDANDLVQYAGGSERMRIDASGNVLVGKTSDDFGVDGCEARPEGAIRITRNANPVAFFNRLTSDGSIVNFYKDSATVGSIGNVGTYLTIGSDDTGLAFAQNLNSIIPHNTSTNAYRDAAVDLGYSTVRFKDLYLSGGAYLGGTGSANKLDDYEEGTFTPRFQQGLTSAGYASQEGTYVKIGSLVVCSIYLRANSGTENGDHIYVGGLPFTVITGTGIDHQYGAFFTYNGGFWSSDANTQWLARANETNLAFYKQADGGAIQGTTSGVATNLNADLRLVAVYRA